jgi:hypothetical protein
MDEATKRLMTELMSVYTQAADSKHGNNILGAEPVRFQSHVGARTERTDTQCLEKPTVVLVDLICQWRHSARLALGYGSVPRFGMKACGMSRGETGPLKMHASTADVPIGCMC